jgi:DNA-directed RNA polymerase subunit RPC12/RpoP
MSTRGKVHCEECERWLSVEGEHETVACDCGHRFVVSITAIPARLAG